MAEKSIMTGKESKAPPELKQRGRDASALERYRNAILTGVIETGGTLPELAVKGASLLPMIPEYQFGTMTRRAKESARRLGALTDDEVTRGGYGEDVARAVAGALGLGSQVKGLAALSRMSRGLSAAPAFGAASGMPLKTQLGQIGRQTLGYDVALPAAATIAGRYAEDNVGVGPLGRAAVELGVGLGAPAAYGFLRGMPGLPGARAANERTALRQMEELGIDPRFAKVDKELNLPSFITSYPELDATASAAQRAAQATQRGQALRTVRGTAFGQQKLAELGPENERRIAAMLDVPPSGASVAPVAQSQIDQATQATLGAISRGQRDAATGEFSNKILGWMAQAQDEKNSLYANLGDARKLGSVPADPLRKAQQDVLDTFRSSAMSSGTLSPERARIREELNDIFERNLAATDAAQQAASASAMAKWQQDAARAKQLMLPEPPKPDVAKVGAQSVPDTISAEQLMRMYKDINGLWRSASPSEKYLLAKLKSGINETLEQNPAVAKAFEEATKTNAEFSWLARSTPGNKSPLVNALDARNPETALQDSMKQLITGQKSAEDARRLARVADMFGEGDELKRLGMAAIEDQAAQQAYQTVFKSPNEVATAAKKARDVIDKSVDFRSALGIPEEVAATSATRIADAGEQLAQTAKTYQQMATDPSAYFSQVLTGSPDAKAQAAAVLNQLKQADPDAAKAIQEGLQSAVQRQFLNQAGGFRHGDAAAFFGIPENKVLMDFIPDATRERVVKASKAQQQLEALRSDPRFGDEFDKAAVANLAALGTQATVGQPGLGYRIGRVLEGTRNIRPGAAEREAALVEALVDPAAAKAMAARNPTFQTSMTNKVLPQAASPLSRLFVERPAQFTFVPPPVETAPVDSDEPEWYLGDEEPVQAQPTGPLIQRKVSPTDEPEWYLE